MTNGMIYKIALWVALSVSLCYAVESPDSDEFDPVFANFCFYKDTSVFVGSDSGFVLTYYEMLDDISFTIEGRSVKTFASFEADLIGLDMSKIQINPFAGTSGSRCLRNDACSFSLSVAPYDLIDFYFKGSDSLYVRALFGVTQRMKWTYELDIGRQKQIFSGENDIYISGLCDREQLEMIKNRRKSASTKELMKVKE